MIIWLNSFGVIFTVHVVLSPGLEWLRQDSRQIVLSSHLVVVIPEADADGAAGPGQDSCHGVEMDQHICYSLQDKLFIHYGLTTPVDKKQGYFNHRSFPTSESCFYLSVSVMQWGKNHIL